MVNWWIMDYEVWRLGGWKGAPGMRAFFGPISFIFMQFSGEKNGQKWPHGKFWICHCEKHFFSKEVPLDIVINVNIDAMSQNQVFLALCPSKDMFLKPTEFTTLQVDEK